MNEIQELNVEELNIENMIYVVRGKEVMLDSDIAKLFNYETKNLNRQVQRNINRFPYNYCFQLTEEEYKNLRCQNVTSSSTPAYGGRRYLPYVFTEHGITMLAGILKSEVAVRMSIKIVNAFVNMRKYISNSFNNINIINNKLLEHDNRLSLVENTLDKLNEKQKVNTIFYKGQIFDAYVVLKEILGSAKEGIIIIDDYAGYKLFDILKTIDKEILVITSNIEEVDYQKYESQYHNIKIKKSDIFHDRFIIIDRKTLYHSGASFKDLGKKCFAINLIEDKLLINDIIKEIDN